MRASISPAVSSSIPAPRVPFRPAATPRSKLSVIDVHGGVQKSGNASFSPAAMTGAQIVSDPLASLALPSAPDSPIMDPESVSGNSIATIGPGHLFPDQRFGKRQVDHDRRHLHHPVGWLHGIGQRGHHFGGRLLDHPRGRRPLRLRKCGHQRDGSDDLQRRLQLLPQYGTDGGTFGAVTLSGNGSVNLTPPSSGTYAGILIYQARDNAKALTFSGNACRGSPARSTPRRPSSPRAAMPRSAAPRARSRSSSIR